MPNLRPTTEIDAVNVMLSMLGTGPVSTLVAPYGVDTAKAIHLLEEFTKKVQVEGWAFNEETDVTLARNSSNEIVMTPNMYSVDADTDPSVDVVERNRKLYDRKNHTFVFDHDVKCEIKYMFPFDELPEVARQYIMICAARAFQERYLGSETQEKFTADDETRARVALVREEGDTRDANILNSPDQAYITRRYERPLRRR